MQGQGHVFVPTAQGLLHRVFYPDAAHATGGVLRHEVAYHVAGHRPFVIVEHIEQGVHHLDVLDPQEFLRPHAERQAFLQLLAVGEVVYMQEILRLRILHQQDGILDGQHPWQHDRLVKLHRLAPQGYLLREVLEGKGYAVLIGLLGGAGCEQHPIRKPYTIL